MHSDSRFRDPLDPSGFVAGDTESRADRGRWTARRALGTAGFVALGLEQERLEVTDSSSFGVALDGAHQSTRAAFGELRWGGARWSGQLGVRDDDNDVYGSHTVAATRGGGRGGARCAPARELR